MKVPSGSPDVEIDALCTIASGMTRPSRSRTILPPPLPLMVGLGPLGVGVLVRTLVGRGDPALVFDAEVEVTLPEGK